MSHNCYMRWERIESFEFLIDPNRIDVYYQDTDPKRYRGFLYFKEQKDGGYKVVVGPCWKRKNCIIPVSEDLTDVHKQIKEIRAQVYGGYPLAGCGMQDVCLRHYVPEFMLENKFEPVLKKKE